MKWEGMQFVIGLRDPAGHQVEAIGTVVDTVRDHTGALRVMFEVPSSLSCGCELVATRVRSRGFKTRWFKVRRHIEQPSAAG